MHLLLLPILKKHWMLALTLFVLLYFVLRFLLNSIFNLNKTTNTKEETVADDILVKTDLPKNSDVFREYKDLANSLAHHLGTKYPWYDPRSLTENDEEVFNILRDLTNDDIEVIETLYFEVYTKNRNLRSDILRLLDKKYLQQLDNF